jgi:hypothetical protein
VKLLTLVDRVAVLTGDARYAIVGGLAQILWARKTHTDDLDVALAAEDLDRVVARGRRGAMPRGWRLPRSTPALESDDILEVLHLTYRGSAVDLLRFHDQAFTSEILETAEVVDELGSYRFIRPELLLVTHLLRPRVEAALAAVELVLARRALGGFDEDYARRWAERAGRSSAFARALARAEEIQSEAR